MIVGLLEEEGKKLKNEKLAAFPRSCEALSSQLQALSCQQKSTTFYSRTREGGWDELMLDIFGASQLIYDEVEDMDQRNE